MKLDLADLYGALGDAEKTRLTEEGVTTRELSELFGVPQNSVQIWVRKWVREGSWVHAGYRGVDTIDGRYCRVPCYKKK